MKTLAIGIVLFTFAVLPATTLSAQEGNLLARGGFGGHHGGYEGERPDLIEEHRENREAEYGGDEDENEMVPEEESTGDDSTVVGEDDEVVGEHDQVVGEDDEVVGEHDQVVGEDDEVVGEHDQVVGEEDDEVVGEEEENGDGY